MGEWRRKITIKLYNPLEEAVVKRIVEAFDSSNIYLNGSGKSGWWGTRTPYGVPSNHKREDEKGLHIRGDDFTEGKIPAYLDINRDRKIVEVDGRTAFDVVEILLDLKIPYEPETDTVTGILEPNVVEEYKRSHKLSEEQVRKILSR